MSRWVCFTFTKLLVLFDVADKIELAGHASIDYNGEIPRSHPNLANSNGRIYAVSSRSIYHKTALISGGVGSIGELIVGLELSCAGTR